MKIAAKLPLVLTLVLCAAALAQEGAAPPPAAPPPAAPPPARAPAPAEAGDEQAETRPAAEERPEVANEDFDPTEELPPDAAVTFPVDI
jgi:hypothetical protein